MKEVISVSRGPYKFSVIDLDNTRSWRFWDLFSNGEWESTTFEALDRTLNSGDLLFDIGAWLGPISIWEAKRGVRVIAIEPDPVAFEALEQTIQLNDFRELITPVQVAVFNERKKLDLHINEFGDSMSQLFAEKFPNIVEVQGETIENLVSTYGKPKVIKMDIEGSESEILPSCGVMLRENPVSLVISLHEIWYKEGTREAMDLELQNWNMRILFTVIFYARRGRHE